MHGTPNTVFSMSFGLFVIIIDGSSNVGAVGILGTE